MQPKPKLGVVEARKASWQQQVLEMVALVVKTVIPMGEVEIQFVLMGAPKAVVEVQRPTAFVARMHSGQPALRARA